MAAQTRELSPSIASPKTRRIPADACAYAKCWDTPRIGHAPWDAAHARSRSAAKIIGENADVDRFHSKEAFARHSGTVPLPVWSSICARHRLSRSGNRQRNAAIHRIALTQARCKMMHAYSWPAAMPVVTADWRRSAFSTQALRRRLSCHVRRPITVSNHRRCLTAELGAVLPSARYGRCEK
ncbi:hypothetical protein CJ177_33265 [Rhodococcus sp. ACPA1]|nr:hypothetical protein CJ177_33265 [Rhodococcus sp. ACPA1]